MIELLTTYHVELAVSALLVIVGMAATMSNSQLEAEAAPVKRRGATKV